MASCCGGAGAGSTGSQVDGRDSNRWRGIFQSGMAAEVAAGPPDLELWHQAADEQRGGMRRSAGAEEHWRGGVPHGRTSRRRGGPHGEQRADMPASAYAAAARAWSRCGRDGGGERNEMVST